MFVGGSVATSFDVEVTSLERQGFRRSLRRDPVVSPLAEKFRGRMVDGFEFGREVGAATKVVYEVLPGGSCGVVTRQFGY